VIGVEIGVGGEYIAQIGERESRERATRKNNNAKTYIYLSEVLVLPSLLPVYSQRPW